MATSETGPGDGIARRLRAADEQYRAIESEIDDAGRERVETIADAYDRATRLLDRYEGKATGTGGEEFRAFVEFQEKLKRFVEQLDDDLPYRETFERMEDRLDKRRVSEEDFERARASLSEPGEVADLLERRREVRNQYREARSDANAELAEIDDEIEELQRLVELGDADLGAPVERLRDPIDAYDEAVREAFREFKRGHSAREVLAFVAETENFPLVEFRQPPEDLREYVEEFEAGTEPLPTLLEYGEYSRSKLSHYVDDAGELKRRVTTQQTYLQRLDAEPLTVGWPPPEAGEVPYLARELIAVCSRFAPASVVERAREVRDLPRTTDYERIRESAGATERLGPEERARLESGDVVDELSTLRDRREELESLLEELPER
jgi:hypothetical protein